jgi:hypothetical protein
MRRKRRRRQSISPRPPESDAANLSGYTRDPTYLIGQFSSGSSLGDTSKVHSTLTRYLRCTSINHNTDAMVVEKEIAGASNDASNAPSLHTIRASGRSRRPTQKVTDSQLQTTPERSPTPRRTRQNRSTFTVFQDRITPPPSQPVTLPTLLKRQRGQDPSTSQKRRRKVTNRASKTNSQEKEQWEQDFDAGSDRQAKFEVLIEALGHEDFLDHLKIPHREATANLVEDLDPLNPLWLWEKFITPEILWTIATHTNENERLHYEAKEKHTHQEQA